MRIIQDEIGSLEMDLKDIEHQMKVAEMECDIALYNSLYNQQQIIYNQIEILNIILEKM